MIQAQDLSKHFDDFIAVDGINLDIPPGNVLVLLGPNGAGKTTTVRMLTSILVPTRGWAVINGYDVVTHPEQVRLSVGLLTEHHSLYNRMNAVEYLSFFGMLYGIKGSVLKARINHLLHDFDLDHISQKHIAEYSKGMRQKLALARAMIHNPPVLLLDEPTSAMDPQSAHMVRNKILEMKSGDRTILLCTHNLVEADELGDEISIIHHGRIIAHDTSQKLKDRWLGSVEYEARFAEKIANIDLLPMPGVVLSGQGGDWLRFRIEDPKHTNPTLIRNLLQERFNLISFSETPHTLEQAYLEAINHSAEERIHA